MNEIMFPSATRDLLVILNENRDNPAPAIDKYLQDFGATCAQKFLTSLTSAPDLFPKDELLKRMKEKQS